MASQTSDKIDLLSLARVAGFATLIATGVVLGLVVLAGVVGANLVVAPEFGSGPPDEMEAWAAAAATVFGGFAGLVLALLSRQLKQRPTGLFLSLCLLGLLAYGFIAVIRSEEISTAIWLNLMHLAAAVPIVGMLGTALVKETSDEGIQST